MSKKAFGKIALAISAVICIAAFLTAQYLGGQKKTVNSYYTSLVRSEFSSFGDLFDSGVLSEETADKLSQENEEFLSKLDLEENDIIHVRVNFKGREMTSLTTGKYFFTVTCYDNNAHDITTGEKCFELVFSGMKWKLSSERPSDVSI